MCYLSSLHSLNASTIKYGCAPRIVIKIVDRLSIIICKPIFIMWAQPKINGKTPSLKEMKEHGKLNAQDPKLWKEQQSINLMTSSFLIVNAANG